MLKVTNRDDEWNPVYYGPLVGLFCGLYMITGTLNFKIMDFWGLALPAGVLVFPLCAILTDLFTEVYGFNRTRKAVWAALACSLLFGFFTQLSIHLKPAAFWPHQESYSQILATSWRLAIAGCCAWVAGEFSNSYVMSKLKIFQKAKYMGLRFIGSTAIGQLLDTTVIALVGFAGTMPWSDFFVMIVAVWLFKIAYEVIALPISIPTAQWVKKLEGIEHFDRQEIHVF